MNDNYPLPTYGKKPPAPSVKRIPITTGEYVPEFTGTRADWEENIFRHAHHFNVFRLHRRSAVRPKEREITVYATFPEALADATLDMTALVYAITLSGDNFCVPKDQWERYVSIWEERT